MRFLGGALALVLTLVATPAFAARILFVGDSIAHATAPALQLRLPNDSIIDAGVTGDVSSNYDRFVTALDAAAPIDTVLLEYGTNDTAPQPPLTPADSFRNIRRLVSAARTRGADVIVLTPPPSICKLVICLPGQPNYQMVVDRNAHVRDLGRLITTYRWPTHVQFLDLRDQWHDVVDGWWGHSDAFGLHPDAAGQVLMADWIATALAP